ncbi:ureidoglycolate lyase [Hasllibacter halocynthiae]|uniref:Ureidoglycolate lyase n=1 Tax=Hasllibacter halocynthiae TaxID=595589 RepID=A0A2T0XA23_9RHOB|nr:ureidoglycolate lyase [Hasllibacter halocynthiae]
MRTVRARPLTEEAIAPYGTVIEAGRGTARTINAGLCTRWHDICRPDTDGPACLSVFEAQPRALPYALDLIERHPLGTQAFLPMTAHPFLVTVSDGPEAEPLAFLTAPHQGVQFHRNVWHGVLTPLRAPGLFAVIDREEGTGNLQEHRFDVPWTIALS